MYTKIIWFELAAFMFSLIALPTMWKIRYLRIYPLLLFIVVVVEGYYSFFPVKSFHNAEVYNIQVPLQYICYLLILYYAAVGKGFKVFLLMSVVGIFLFTILTNIFFTQKGHSNIWSYSLCSIIIIVGIIWKFYEMLKNPVEFNFLRNPFFYMLFAFLLFNLVTLPYFSMGNWLYTTKTYRNVYLMLERVTSFINYVLYTTYSIAFVWIVQKKGIY